MESQDEGGQLAPYPWNGETVPVMQTEHSFEVMRFEVMRLDDATREITIPPGDTPFTMSRDAEGNVIFAHPGGHVSFHQTED